MSDADKPKEEDKTINRLRKVFSPYSSEELDEMFTRRDGSFTEPTKAEPMNRDSGFHRFKNKNGETQ